MFCLYDTFNGREISRHRSLVACYRAKARIDRSVSNGSYLPMFPRRIVRGELVRLDNDEQQEWIAIDREFRYSPSSSIR